MEYKLYLQLLPCGKFAKKGKYQSLQSRTLRFDVRLELKEMKNYDTMELEDIMAVSICGSPNKSRGADQCIDELVRKYRDRVPQDKLADFDKLVELWRSYHLNDLTAGTKRQEEALSEWRKTHTYDYDAAKEYLKSLGILEDNEYVYGTGWLGKPVPYDVVAFIERLSREWAENGVIIIDSQN